MAAVVVGCLVITGLTHSTSNVLVTMRTLLNSILSKFQTMLGI